MPKKKKTKKKAKTSKKELSKIFFTGRTMDDFKQELQDIENNKSTKGPQCYLCKRRDGEESALVRSSKDSHIPSYGPMKLKVKPIVCKDVDGTKWLYPLCDECELLLETFAEPIEEG